MVKVDSMTLDSSQDNAQQLSPPPSTPPPHSCGCSNAHLPSVPRQVASCPNFTSALERKWTRPSFVSCPTSPPAILSHGQKEGLTYNGCGGHGQGGVKQERIVVMPQVAQEISSEEDKTGGETTETRNEEVDEETSSRKGAGWFIGLAPSVEDAGQCGSGEGVEEDLSEYDQFFPELYPVSVQHLYMYMYMGSHVLSTVCVCLIQSIIT